jgi:hypothetical protein
MRIELKRIYEDLHSLKQQHDALDQSLPENWKELALQAIASSTDEWGIASGGRSEPRLQIVSKDRRTSVVLKGSLYIDVVLAGTQPPLTGIEVIKVIFGNLLKTLVQSLGTRWVPETKFGPERFHISTRHKDFEMVTTNGSLVSELKSLFQSEKDVELRKAGEEIFLKLKESDWVPSAGRSVPGPKETN